MITVGLIGVLLERVAYRPLRGTGRLPPVISALGAAFILESAARNLYGASYQVYPAGCRHVGALQSDRQSLSA
jgi:branched-chain amino acid transport system permease protein